MLTRFLIILCALSAGCGSRAADPTADLGTTEETKVPPPGQDLDCPEAAPLDGASCTGHDEGLECKYVIVYCPENPMGPFYHYENDVYRCVDGEWSYEGQDCYGCCRPRAWWTDAGPDAGYADGGYGGDCIPPAPSPGCDFCGKLVCPTGSSIDSACKCYVPGEGYVAPVAQTCDFCCGKVCPAGQFLDHACTCYLP